MALKNLKEYVPPIKAHNAGIVKVDQVELTATTEPSDSNLAGGRMYFSSVDDTFYGYDGSNWKSFIVTASAGAGTWDSIYNVDKTLTINSTTLTFAGTHATGNALTLTATGSGDCLHITNAGTGYDIAGTSDEWSIKSSGNVGVLELGSSGTINATDGALTIGSSGTATTLAGTLTVDEASTLTGAVTATASITITGTADTDCLTVTAGDVVITNGTITQTNDDNSNAFALTANSCTTTDAFTISATGTTSGSALQITTANATLSGGYYIECYDGAAIDFSVGEHGAVVIEGSAAGTDALTLSLGDIEVTDSDANQISSVDGTDTLLTLDNEGGAIGSGKSILKLDSGGVMNAGAYGLHIVFNGANAAGTTMVYLEPDAGSLGIYIDGASTALREALKIDADTSGNYHMVSFHTDSAHASGYATLNVDTGGAMAAGAHLVKFDLGSGIPNATSIAFLIDAASITGTTKPTVMKIDGDGKDCKCLEIVSDPSTKDVVSIASDSVIASGMASLKVTAEGAIASGGSILRVDALDGAPASGAIFTLFDFANIDHTNEVIGVKIDAGGKHVQALYVDADPTTGSTAYFHSDAVIHADQGVVHIDSAGAIADNSSALRVKLGGTPAGAASYAAEFDLTGVTADNNPGGVFVNGGGKDVAGIKVDTDNTDIHAVEITGSGVLTSAGNMLYVHNNGDCGAGANLIQVKYDGTATNNPTLVDLYGTSKDVQAISSDTDNTATHAVGITGSGVLTSAGSMLYVANDATNAADSFMVKFALTGTDTNKMGVLSIDADTHGPAIKIDQDGTHASTDQVAIDIDTDNSGNGDQVALNITMVDESKSYFAKFANATSAWTSTKSPETDAEAGWIKIDVNGTAQYIPYYDAS